MFSFLCRVSILFLNPLHVDSLLDTLTFPQWFAISDNLKIFKIISVVNLFYDNEYHGKYGLINRQKIKLFIQNHMRLEETQFFRDSKPKAEKRIRDSDILTNCINLLCINLK